MKPVPKKEGPSDKPPHGYVVRIDARAIGVAAASAQGGAEVVLRAAVGSFVGCRDEPAEVRLDAGGDADGLARAVMEIGMQTGPTPTREWGPPGEGSLRFSTTAVALALN